MDFVAIDFETANRSKSSICQVGIVRYRGGMLVETWSALVNPEDDFEDAYHSDLHGIQADHVVAAPKFPEVYPVIKRLIEGERCVYHGDGNDPGYLENACVRYSLNNLSEYCEWVSTLKMARSAWPDAHDHSLATLSQMIGHHLEKAHDALEDALCVFNFRISSCSGVSAPLPRNARPSPD